MKRRVVIATVATAAVATTLGAYLLGAATSERARLLDLAQDGRDTSGAGGVDEGIGIRGDWTIEVRNPDGSLATRQQFANALWPRGTIALADVLAGLQGVGRWRLVLQKPGRTGAQAICDQSLGSSPGAGCIITEDGTSPSSGDVPERFQTLTVSVLPDPTTDSNDSFLKLEGSAVADRTGKITQVRTEMQLCPPSITVENCQTGLETGKQLFTIHQLAREIDLAARQQVLVTVEIRFTRVD